MGLFKPLKYARDLPDDDAQTTADHVSDGDNDVDERAADRDTAPPPGEAGSDGGDPS